MENATLVYGRRGSRRFPVTLGSTSARSVLSIFELLAVIVTYILTSALDELSGNTGILLTSHLTANACSSTLRLITLWIKYALAKFNGHRILQHLLTWLMSVSIYSLCAININVCLAVTLGRNYTHVMTQRTAQVLVVVIWTGNAIILFSPLVLVDTFMTPAADELLNEMNIQELVCLVIAMIVLVLLPVMALMVSVGKLRNHCKHVEVLGSTLKSVVLIVKLVCRYTALHLTLEGVSSVLIYVKLLIPKGEFRIWLKSVRYLSQACHICKPLVYMLFYEPLRNMCIQYVRRFRNPFGMRVVPIHSGGLNTLNNINFHT